MKKFVSFLLVMIMTIALSLPAFATTLPTDVSETHWAAEAVEMLMDLGILSGYTDQTFRGQQNITRYEIAVALQRLLNYVESSGQTEAIVSMLEASDIDMTMLVEELNKILNEYATTEDLVALEKRVTALESKNIAVSSPATTTVTSNEVAVLKSELSALQESYNVAVRDLVALNERLSYLEGQQNVTSSSSVKAVEVQATTGQTTTNSASTGQTTNQSGTTSNVSGQTSSTGQGTKNQTSTGQTTSQITTSTTANTTTTHSINGKSIGLRSDLFDSNSMAVDSIVVPKDFAEGHVGNMNDGIFALSTINYRANSDLYITLKSAVRKTFRFTSPIGTSALISATYLMSDKFALNFRLSDIGEINALGEYLIINNDKLGLAAQLGVGYKKVNIEGFFIGLDLLASYDILSNLNLSASVGVDYDFSGKYLIIEDEIAVSYVPIKYANLYLAYERKDAISVDNSGNFPSDTLTFAVGSGIKDEYFAKDDYFDFRANKSNRFNDVRAYDEVLTPGKDFKDIALTNNLSLNYNVILKLSNLLDDTTGIGDSLDITVGLGYKASKFDASFFVGAYLSGMFDGAAGVDTDMQLALGLGYQINNSLKVGLNVGTWLDNLSNVDAFVYISPSITYAVNNNMNIKLSYIADLDFSGSTTQFGSAIGIGAEIKF